MVTNMNKAKMINDAVISTALREAREEGLEMGIETKSIEVAMNFLRMGLALEQIAAGTGLTIEQIRDLQSKLE